MDEDLQTLIAAMQRVANSDAKIRRLAAKRRLEHFPPHLCRVLPADAAIRRHKADDSGA